MHPAAVGERTPNKTACFGLLLLPITSAQKMQNRICKRHYLMAVLLESVFDMQATLFCCKHHAFKTIPLWFSDASVTEALRAYTWNPNPVKQVILPTAFSTEGNAIASVRLSVRFPSIFRTDWPLALIFCVCVGHHHGSQETETESQGQGSMRSDWPRSLIEDNFFSYKMG